jgi:hypothetical protein
MYQNSKSLSSFETLISERLLEHFYMRKPWDFGTFAEVYRKRTFLIHSGNPRSSWTQILHSANFAFWAFSEVRPGYSASLRLP